MARPEEVPSPAGVVASSPMTTVRRLCRPLGALAAAGALALAGCSSGSSSGSSNAGAPAASGSAAGSASGAAASASGGASSAAPTAGGKGGKLDPVAAAPPASYTVKPPADPCSVPTADAVRMFTLGKATTSKAAPPNGCLFLDSTGQVVFLYRLSTKEQLPGGIESLRNGAQSAMGASATSISIRGFPGFVVTGQGTGTLETQMAVTVGDFVLECSVPKGGDLTDQRSITGEAIATILDTIVTVG